ncbi:MAG: DUF4190 domain-containing protein [Pirellulales bacterium]
MLRTDAGQTYGPISRAELENWVQQGRVSPSAWLAYEGATEWQRADALFPSLNPRAGSSTGNPWAERPAWVAGGAAAAGGVYGQSNWPNNAIKQPHRGVVILVLGVLGWLFCFLFGVVAFALGQADVRAMRRGEMDESGMGMTQAGMYLGLANVILSLLFLAFVVVMGILGDM